MRLFILPFTNILLFFVLFLMVPVEVSALSEKQCRKIAERVDVGAAVTGMAFDNPGQFWRAVVESNVELTKFNKNILKKGNVEIDTRGRMADLPKFDPEYDSSICTEYQTFCDSLFACLGADTVIAGCSLHVVYSDSINTFSVPVGDNRFAICITLGLLARDGLTCEMLLGLVAREYVHAILRHNIRKFHALEKRRRDPRWRGIWVDYSNLPIDMEAFLNSPADNPEYYIQFIDNRSLLYTFRYLPDQEYEADIVALRFMQAIGLQDSMIAGVKLLGDRYDLNYRYWEEHPDVGSRVDVLNYVVEKCTPKTSK